MPMAATVRQALSARARYLQWLTPLTRLIDIDDCVTRLLARKRSTQVSLLQKLVSAQCVLSPAGEERRAGCTRLPLFGIRTK
jgi:malate/lactate dehydrogenase